MKSPPTPEGKCKNVSKNAIERAQSQACLNYAEREHFGRKSIIKCKYFRRKVYSQLSELKVYSQLSECIVKS